MSRALYDDTTLAKLVHCHGADRAAQIALGKDRATNRDIEAWRRCCGIGEPVWHGTEDRRPKRPDPTQPLEERVMWYAARDIKPTVIASYFHVPAERVIQIIEDHA